MTKEQDAERWLYRYLGKILGPKRHGLVSYGLRFDPKLKTQYIGVEFEPTTSSSVLSLIPKNVGDVDVRVQRTSLQLERASR